MTDQSRPLNRRERHILNVLAQMHHEFGRDSQITAAAVEHIAGPCAGSLAGLTMAGLVTQRAGALKGQEGMLYWVTPEGHIVASSSTIRSVLIP